MIASQSQSSGRVIDASRAQDQYQGVLDSLTAGGHIGAAVAASTAASSKPKELPPVQISERLKHTVELARRERVNGYQLTGGVKPRNQTPKRSVQALKTLRGGNNLQTRFL